MNVDRRYRNLMAKLINAQIDLSAYLQLRRAKGYMSVTDNDHLRDNLFELCSELRENAALLATLLTPEERDALRQTDQALASAAVCLMTGHHDCPAFITVNPEILQRCLDTLTENIHLMNNSAPMVHS